MARMILGCEDLNSCSTKENVRAKTAARFTAACAASIVALSSCFQISEELATIGSTKRAAQQYGSTSSSKRGGIKRSNGDVNLDDSSLTVNFHGNLVCAHNDEELLTLLQRARIFKNPVVYACRQMLPTFCNLSNDYKSAMFVYTDVDMCYETTRDVRYTATFRFFRDGGDELDEFNDTGPRRLRDRVWPHTQTCQSRVHSKLVL